MLPKNFSCRTHGIATCGSAEGSVTMEIYKNHLFYAFGKWLELSMELIPENMRTPVKCSASLVTYTGRDSLTSNNPHPAHERILKSRLLWHRALHVEATVKSNSRWKTPQNLLLAICHFWVLANELNLQLIYNDLNSKKSSCTLISVTFPLGFASSQGFLELLFPTHILSLKSHQLAPSKKLLGHLHSRSLSLFVLFLCVLGFLSSLWLCFSSVLILQENAARSGYIFILLPAWLLLIFKSLLAMGPFAVSLGIPGMVFCSCLRVSP